MRRTEEQRAMREEGELESGMEVVDGMGKARQGGDRGADD
jgi:hypothetical protein